MKRYLARVPLSVLMGLGLVAIVAIACAPAAPVDARPAVATASARAVATATPFDQSTFAPSLSATPSPLVIPTPAPPPGALLPPILPPSMLEGGERLPNIDEIMAQGMSRVEAELEHIRLRAAFVEGELEAGRLQRVSVSGPETAGTTFTIAGKTIKLPPDAQLGGVLLDVLCRVGDPCPQAPLRIVERQGQTISIDRLGQVWTNDAGPLEPEAIPEMFAFLRLALFP
ncbi:MAG: hypothetical protein O3B84_00995 [Chloroflexi bacterium]|nr:hypothetical protein [Chloroflexota bacterium]